MMNKNEMSGGWKELKGRIRSAWGDLTDDEFESAKGNATSLAGIIQRKFGVAQEEVRSKIHSWLSEHRGRDSDDKADRRPA